MEDHAEQSILPEKPVNYSGFWRRFAAHIIDTILFSIGTRAIQFAFHLPNIGTAFVKYFYIRKFTGNEWLHLVEYYLAGALINWLYYTLLESGPQQATVGKMAMKIKVTNLHGDRISFAQASGRFFGKYISGLILYIGYIMMIWDGKKQTLHDKMAATLVVAG